MAIEAAQYDSVTQNIFGVRGQWVYQFNATSGALENSLRFTTNATCTSCMTILNGKIYVGVSYTPITDYNQGNSLDRDIFIVDTTTFLTTGRFNLGVTGKTLISLIPTGFRDLTNDGTRIAGFNTNGVNPQDTAGLFEFDPLNLAGTFNRNSFNWADDMTYDAFNDVYWVADSSTPNVWCVDNNPIFGSDSFNNGLFRDLFGITYNSAQNKVYVVTGSQTMYMANAADAMPGFNPFNLTTLVLGNPAFNPYRVKSCNGLVGNPFNGKVLIPTWAGDSVVVWNPSTDAIDSTKSGFTAPIDVVYTPSKAFAVQNAAVGLKEIV